MTSDSIRAALHEARLYLCTDARVEQGDLKEFLDAVFAGGVDIVQLRHKDPDGCGLEAREELRYLEVVAEAAARHGKLWAVNDRADIAAASGAPVLHLGQDDLPVRAARDIVGEGPAIGRSTHGPAQFDAAALEPGIDYLCAGPTWETPTKPGRPAAGPALLRHAAARSAAQSPGMAASGMVADDRPWFAIGGIDLDRLDEVIALGARRVVVVRAITQAPDPAEAARTIADRLRRAGA